MKHLLLLLIISVSAHAQDSNPLQQFLAGDSDTFKRATAMRTFHFPDDHGPHDGFQTEWWYFTGNLESEQGRHFGYQLTFFRYALAPTPIKRESRWATDHVFMAHFAITDVTGQRFYHRERFSREALGLAGAQASPLRVWLNGWQMTGSDDDLPLRLVADDDEFAIDIQLRAVKAPVLQGDDGLSQKSSEPGNASYYYSLTRLQTDGSLTLGNERFVVRGESWLDREWSTSALGETQAGWDWFALQLADNSELMFYRLRHHDGSTDPYSAGSYVDADGTVTHLNADEVTITVLDEWQSPAGGRYPARWRITVPVIGRELEVIPRLANQELNTTTVRYWEGAVTVEGEVSGKGYVELTGYAE